MVTYRGVTQMKKWIHITIDHDVLERIDKERGLIPRSTWINDQLKKAVEGQEVGGANE